MTETAVLNNHMHIASQLPKADCVHIIVQTDEFADAEWQLGAYGQFLRDDSEEDAIYEPLRQPIRQNTIT